MTEDELFFAWLDGELDPEEAALYGERVANDPELTALANEHRGLIATLRDAFNSIPGEQKTEDLVAPIMRSSP